MQPDLQVGIIWGNPDFTVYTREGADAAVTHVRGQIHSSLLGPEAWCMTTAYMQYYLAAVDI